MPKVLLTGGSRSWSKEKFIAKIADVMKADLAKMKGRGKNKKGGGEYLVFKLADHSIRERWVTAVWRRLLDEKKIGAGDVVSVVTRDEEKLPKGRKFRPVDVELLTGAEIPKSLRSK
jgi:hypothetical protein